MKRYLRIAVVLVLAVGLSFAGLRYFLTSPFLARQVAKHLSRRIGLAVSVEGIRVGLQGTTLFNVRLAGDDGNLPLLRVDKLETDLTLWKLLCGQTTPQEIALQGAHLTLCFDQSGELVVPVTNVPTGPAAGLPRTHFRSGQLTVQREGWATLSISGIDAEITDAGRLVFSGSLHDTAWKGWSFHGTFCATDSSLCLSSDGDVPLSPALLQSIPFIPNDVWRHVRFGGPTAVEVRLAYRPFDASMHYRVRLTPRQGVVEIPEMNFVGTNVQGEALIEDGTVTLTDVRGRALGGELRISGALDFSGEEGVYECRVGWQDVTLAAYFPEAPPAGANRGSAVVRGKVSGVWGGDGTLVLQRCEVIHLDGPAAQGSDIRLLAAGSVSATGRLDFSATARASRAPPEPMFRILGDPFSHILVRVDVTGTVDRPAYQIHPLPSLTADASRFLLPQSNSD
jgi:hypothetical protein